LSLAYCQTRLTISPLVASWRPMKAASWGSKWTRLLVLLCPGFTRRRRWTLFLLNPASLITPFLDLILWFRLYHGRRLYRLLWRWTWLFCIMIIICCHSLSHFSGFLQFPRNGSVQND
jgi:hypothetical protein